MAAMPMGYCNHLEGVIVGIPSPHLVSEWNPWPSWSRQWWRYASLHSWGHHRGAWILLGLILMLSVASFGSSYIFLLTFDPLCKRIFLSPCICSERKTWRNTKHAGSIPSAAFFCLILFIIHSLWQIWLFYNFIYFRSARNALSLPRFITLNWQSKNQNSREGCTKRQQKDISWHIPKSRDIWSGKVSQQVTTNKGEWVIDDVDCVRVYRVVRLVRSSGRKSFWSLHVHFVAYAVRNEMFWTDFDTKVLLSTFVWYIMC
jgi:hypothetical protein